MGRAPIPHFSLTYSSCSVGIGLPTRSAQYRPMIYRSIVIKTAFQAATRIITAPTFKRAELTLSWMFGADGLTIAKNK